MAYAHGTCSRGSRRHTATIDVLSDDIFLEIFAFCSRDPDKDLVYRMLQWQRLVHVCQRWRQIIYASPRYLDLFLYCSTGTPVRNLSCWPKFPIIMCYISDDENDVIALLNQSDRLRSIDLSLMRPQLGKVVAAMQEPFPVLTQLTLDSDPDIFTTQEEEVISNGFLGGSAPCLQEVHLCNISFPELPTLLLSARDLVSLHLDDIPPTGYIPPEAMVVGLAVLTRLEYLLIHYQIPNSPLNQRTRHPDPPMRVVLPALTVFYYRGCSEYLEDFVAQLDAPRLDYIEMSVDRLDSFRLPQLFMFTARSETLRFTRAQVVFNSDQTFNIELYLFDRTYGEPKLDRAHFSLSTSLEWSGTHVAYLAHVLGQIALFSNLGYLCICASEDLPGWQGRIDIAEWLAFLHLFASVEILYVSGGLAGQVVRVLEDIPGETVTEASTKGG